MTVSITCASCATTMRLPETALQSGRILKCPQCKASLNPNSPPRPSALERPAPRAEEPMLEEVEPSPAAVSPWESLEQPAPAESSNPFEDFHSQPSETPQLESIPAEAWTQSRTSVQVIYLSLCAYLGLQLGVDTLALGMSLLQRLDFDSVLVGLNYLSGGVTVLGSVLAVLVYLAGLGVGGVAPSTRGARVLALLALLSGLALAGCVAASRLFVMLEVPVLSVISELLTLIVFPVHVGLMLGYLHALASGIRARKTAGEIRVFLFTSVGLILTALLLVGIGVALVYFNHQQRQLAGRPGRGFYQIDPTAAPLLIALTIGVVAIGGLLLSLWYSKLLVQLRNDLDLKLGRRPPRGFPLWGALVLGIVVVLATNFVLNLLWPSFFIPMTSEW